MFRKFLASIVSIFFIVFFFLFVLFHSIISTFSNELNYLDNEFIDISHSYITELVFENLPVNPVLLSFNDFTSFSEFFINVFDKETLKDKFQNLILLVKEDKIYDLQSSTLTIPLSELLNESFVLEDAFIVNFLEKNVDCKNGDKIFIIYCENKDVGFTFLKTELTKELNKSIKGDFIEDLVLEWHFNEKFSDSFLIAFEKTRFYLYSLFSLILFLAIGLIFLLLWSPILMSLRWISVLITLSSVLSLFIFYSLSNANFFDLSLENSLFYGKYLSIYYDYFISKIFSLISLPLWILIGVFFLIFIMSFLIKNKD